MAKDITVRWQYSSGQDYEYKFDDAALAGKLYRLKMLEPNIERIEVFLGDHLVIRWIKPDEKE